MPYGKLCKINKERPRGDEEIFRKTVEQSVTSEVSPALPEPVLVGRECELEELKICLNSACEGKGSIVFVSGEAGAGKTRLLNEFVSAAKKKKKATLLTGWCVSNAGGPYFPFIEAFNGFFKSSEECSYSQSKREATHVNLNATEHFDDDKYEVTSWLMNQQPFERSSIPEGLSPQVRKDLTFGAVAKSLVSLSEEKPVVLFIDDLHWADSASLLLLHYLARAVNSQRILVVAAFRSEELTTDVGGHPHFLVEVLRALKREDFLKEIKLTGLNQSDISKIAENMLGGRVDPEFVKKLSIESQGNPFFVIESLRMLKDRELYEEKGEWRLSVDTLGVPKKVKEIILRRLNALNRDQRRTLNAASVIGEKFDTDLVAATLRQGNIDVLETLHAISQSTALVFCKEDFFKFAHAMYREVIYEEIPEALRKGYHSEIAEIIEKNSDGSKLPLSDLAHHYREAGNEEKAIKYALAAGQDAVARFSNTEAIKHFTYVSRIVGEGQNFRIQRLSALEGLGDALIGNGMVNEAMSTFLTLSSISSDVVRLRALRKALEASSFLGGTPNLTELVNKAEEYSGADKLEHARVLRVRAHISLVRQCLPEVALKEAEEALQVFEDEASLPDLAYALMTLGAIYGSMGQNEKGIIAVLRSVALLGELEDGRGQASTYLIAGEYCFAGLADEMLTMFRNASKISDTIADIFELAWAYSDCGWANEYAGRVSEALPWTLKALLQAEKTDSPLIRGVIYGGLARQYTFLGNAEIASEYFKKMVALPEEILSNPLVGDLSKAVYFAGKGKWDESTEFFRKCLRAKINPGYQAWIHKNLAWALQKQRQTKEAKIHWSAAQRIVKELENTVAHVKVQASLVVPKKAEVGQRFDLRCDLVNISRNEGSLESFEMLVPASFKLTAFSGCTLQDGRVRIQPKVIGAFQVETIKLSMTATQKGVYSFCPRIVYVDDLGKSKECKPKPISITVMQASSLLNEESVTVPDLSSFAFQSKGAEAAFSYLVQAFVKDYVRQRLPQDQSGWRTLMDITRHRRMSQYSLYGSPNRRGPALTELEQLGVVETRYFPGERGRGGKALKLRIAWEKETIKRYLNLNDSA